jgi:hypothetical protein
LESCGGIDFERHQPNAHDAEQMFSGLTREGRLPRLDGVRVYFICRVGAKDAVSGAVSVYHFWESFFKTSQAKSVQIGPDLIFDAEPRITPETVKEQCDID